jgi:hypothetical protein
MAVLPRRSRRCRSVANAHGANAPSERLAIDRSRSRIRY